jgi:hypothetical protein
MTIGQVPSDVVAEALSMVVRSSGNIAKLQGVPPMTAGEFKASMEKAKQGEKTP